MYRTSLFSTGSITTVGSVEHQCRVGLPVPEVVIVIG